MTYDYERDPAAIYERSFAIVRSEAPLAHLHEDEEEIAVRIVHACGMPDIVDDLLMSEGAVQRGRAALGSGAAILADAKMVSHGIIRTSLPASNEVVCTLNDAPVPALAAKFRTTRSAAQLELWGDRLSGAVVTIGNAPTALFRLLELIEAGAPRPALVIGMPVGFVGAAESKEALIASGLPHLVVRGRRGGSAMAAACVNALALGAQGSTGRTGSQNRTVAMSSASSRRERIIVQGADAGGALDPRTTETVRNADVVFGPERLLDRLDAIHGAEIVAWPTPFSAGVDQLVERHARNDRIAVLASGDPMHFGIGGTLADRLGIDALDVRPSPSAFSLAAARLGWAIERTACISLHGGTAMERGVATLAQHVAPRRRVIALTTDGSTPREVADWLSERGFGPSRLTVLERMGSEEERRLDGVAERFEHVDIDPLNTLAIECVGTGNWHSLAPGLPDDNYEHDGKMTKSEMRALAVSRLRPRPHGCLWDIGAGSGAVGLEWLRLSPGGSVVAFEPRKDRRATLVRNFQAFGLAVTVRSERFNAWAATRNDGDMAIDRPDAIFVGGGLSNDVATLAWDRLSPGGAMVANAVTLEGETELAALHGRFGGELTRVAVQRAEPVGPFRGWRAAMPVTMWSAIRGDE